MNVPDLLTLLFHVAIAINRTKLFLQETVYFQNLHLKAVHCKKTVRISVSSLGWWWWFVAGVCGAQKMMKLNEAVAINGFVLLFMLLLLLPNKLGKIYIGLVDH